MSPKRSYVPTRGDKVRHGVGCTKNREVREIIQNRTMTPGQFWRYIASLR